MTTSNIARMLDWARYRFSSQDALIYEDQHWTYWQLDEEVNAIAAALSEAGIGRDDRIAIIGTNVPGYILLAFALAKLGAVAVTLNYRLHEEELVSQIERSGSIGLAAEHEFSELAASLVSRVPALKWRVSFDDQMAGDFHSLDDLIEKHRGQRVPDLEIEDDQLQRIVYTSGTTGLPKGAMLTHGNVLANINAQISELGLTSQDRILNFAPLYHVGGFDIPGFATFYVGATMVLLRRFDTLKILQTVSEQGITGTCMVATMVHLMRDHPERDQFDMTSVKWLIFSQVSETLFQATAEQFPNARMIEGYGLTETCNGVAYLDAAHMQSKLGSVGRPLHGVDIRIVDDEDRVLGEGERGEVVIRGPKVSPGYFGDNESTQRAFRGGWFHTGDVGYFDADGYLYIVDRLKDMIRSGGENIASSEIERVIYEIPTVAEVAVVRMAHPKWLEVPAAMVVARPEMNIDAAAVIEYCGTRLGRFKVPKAIFILDELPRNATGKVLKEVLRERIESMEPAWSAESDFGRSA